MIRYRSTLLGLLFLGCAGLYVTGVQMLSAQRQAKEFDDRLRVALPVPVQLVLSGGDRFLAANINVFRAMMVNTRSVDDATVEVQAQLQTDAARFNPGHEDNYYIAAATLAWQGQLGAAQDVLFRAMAGRPTDIYPPFFYGFNKQYFEGDYLGAARAIEEAARRTSGANSAALQAMAARWHEKGKDTGLALATLRAMAAKTKDPGLRHYIESRAQRLEQLLMLREAARRYRERENKPIADLADLVRSGDLQQLPQDPTGLGYMLDAQGTPVLAGAKPLPGSHR
ncbi:MAG: hypothetical protein H6R07_2381 [Proteobacteria bacterium]|nr:hypothetical protein [Pseudomonadota bacterium]